ncbi:MAG: hypothetical protein C3F07_17780 [Anaerolineales bacterium]|nr:MAG: hypothetical protein C3F07_17780 [Anaerolineales bacterium]
MFKYMTWTVSMKDKPTTEERIWAALSHLSAIAFGMGILLPVIGWSEQRWKSNYASFQSLQALGYQSLGYTIWILTTLVLIIFSSMGLVLGMESIENLDAELWGWVIAHMILMFGLIGLYLLLPVVGAITCALGWDFRYPVLGNRLAKYLGYDSINDERPWLIEEHEDRWVAAMGHFAVIIMLWGMLAPATAWVLRGKHSPFLKFQSIQTVVYQILTTGLYFGSGVVYSFGFFAFVLITGFGTNAGLDSSTGMIGILVLLASIFVAMIIVMVVPMLHILGQWAGYRVLKGDEYRYPVLGRLIERWTMRR